MPPSQFQQTLINEKNDDHEKGYTAPKQCNYLDTVLDTDRHLVG